jgi:hypothetical protein
MLVVVHCVEEAVREKKRKRTVKINWLRVRRLGGYKKNVFKGVHVYGGYTFTVYTVVGREFAVGGSLVDGFGLSADGWESRVLGDVAISVMGGSITFGLLWVLRKVLAGLGA